jgi:hypothetical protein
MATAGRMETGSSDFQRIPKRFLELCVTVIAVSRRYWS